MIKKIRQHRCRIFFISGDPAGIRTPDNLLKRQVLYLLSYWIKMAGMAGLEPTISESKSGVLPLHYIPWYFCLSGTSLQGGRINGLPQVLGWVKGFEPSTLGTTIRCSNQLSYTHRVILARQEGLEPPTYCLEGSCSIHLSYWRTSRTSKMAFAIYASFKQAQ
jgi:hypothetical protein